ncbi:uncharacterized protein A4U43_C09F950 [Asparagus officinalis]|uniref:Uncharacterized protein n=1 Tax=Asparagus officinalis TaxID=4686 RepID=A0A5P1E4B5_ASPOF|nr:uncharacterized protein A4U43_C09F950 [Asparagus officinalis]
MSKDQSSFKATRWSCFTKTLNLSSQEFGISRRLRNACSSPHAETLQPSRSSRLRVRLRRHNRRLALAPRTSSTCGSSTFLLWANPLDRHPRLHPRLSTLVVFQSKSAPHDSVLFERRSFATSTAVLTEIRRRIVVLLSGDSLFTSSDFSAPPTRDPPPRPHSTSAARIFLILTEPHSDAAKYTTDVEFASSESATDKAWEMYVI